LPADITKKEHREIIVSKTLKKWGKIDLLVNNAGAGIYGDFLQISEMSWYNIFEINLFATVFLTKITLPIMLKQDSGIIVNIASIGGLVAHSDKVVPYISAKHAVVGFSRGLAKELKNTNIKVKVVCPHLISTDFFKSSEGAEEMALILEKYRNFMDSAEKVAYGIINGLNSNKLIIFPTEKPENAYNLLKDI
jgi:short-subunit dehydrogenase